MSDEQHSARDRSCVLHLGLPRTGTKTLQWYLFARHSQIHYLGAYIGEPFADKRVHRNMRDAATCGLMEELAWGDLRWPNFERCRRLYRQAVAPQLEQGKVPVLSWESFAINVPARRRQQACNLRKVFGPCRVALTLRRPVDLIESTYFLIVRRENRPGRRRGLWYQPIDDWLDDEYDWEIAPHLDYLQTIEIYQELFGESSVKLFLFEQLREDPAGYVEAWCRFLGVDPAQGVRLTANRAENSTASALVARARRIHRSRLLTVLYNSLPARKRFEWMSLPPVGRAPERPRISAAGRQRIADSTRRANRRLVERFGLPLERWGYPL